MPYRSSNLRITNQQQIYEQLSSTILNYIRNIAKESDAETLWLGLRAQGSTMSQSTFNNRLKKLVDAGLVTKRSLGYNKHFYLASA